MLTTQKPPVPATATARVQIIQKAEMIDTTGIRSLVTINGVLMMSSTPTTPAQATEINAAISAIGGES
jgi:hypothetical protein